MDKNEIEMTAREWHNMTQLFNHFDRVLVSTDGDTVIASCGIFVIQLGPNGQWTRTSESLAQTDLDKLS